MCRVLGYLGEPISLRTLLLVLPRVAFERLFNGEESESHVFLDVINRDLVAALRQVLRPQARLAASV
jgi:hypothetical protein